LPVVLKDDTWQGNGLFSLVVSPLGKTI